MSVPYTLYIPSPDDPTVGIILRSGWCQPGDYELQAKVGQLILPVRSDDTIHAVEIPWDGSPPGLVDKVIVPPALSELKAAAKAQAAERRWQIEVGGVAFYGSTISTDDRSKLLISSAAAQARDDSEFTTRWKTKEGWVDLDAASIIAVYAAVFAHVQGCFNREEELAIAIDAAEDTAAMVALEPVIAAFWPV